MLCEECGKRPATVHFTKIINGQKSEAHLCQICAAQKGGFQMDFSLNFNDFFKNFFDPGQGPGKFAVGLEAEHKCSRCGLSYRDFTKNSKFGCPHCYREFRGMLEPLLRRIHGSSRHLGKVPQRTGGKIRQQREIEWLRAELQRKINNEEYEAAAQIRDRLRALTNNQQQEQRG